MDDFSGYILSWELCPTMQAVDAERTLQKAMQAAGLPKEKRPKIERYHRSMKNLLLLDFYYLPQELEQRIGEWVAYHNHHRYHESLNNLTPADVFFGHKQEKLQQREKIKQLTLTKIRKSYIGQQLQNP